MLNRNHSVPSSVSPSVCPSVCVDSCQARNVSFFFFSFTFSYHIWHFGLPPSDDMWRTSMIPQGQTYKGFDMSSCPTRNIFLLWHWHIIWHWSIRHWLWSQQQFVGFLTWLRVRATVFFLSFDIVILHLAYECITIMGRCDIHDLCMTLILG